MLFVIHAYDAQDAQAPARRMAAREAHLAMVKEYVAKGHHKFGAAMLNDAGQMCGSLMLVEFEDRAACDAWLNTDPYVTQNVWHTINVNACNVAPSFVDVLVS